MSILDQLGIDPAILFIILFALVILLFILFIVVLVQNRKMKRKLDIFMRGSDAESLEDIIRRNMVEIDAMKRELKSHKIDLSSLHRVTGKSCSKMGIIKYNGFVGMGGKASFALTLLDSSDSGIILNVIHSRDGAYPYVKEVTRGICETSMSAEEKASLEMAMRSR